MAKYTFKCEHCNTVKQTYASLSTQTIICSCGNKMLRQMPILNGPSKVTEVVDKYTGRTWMRDQEQEVKMRRDDYYWSIEVPRFVSSGVYAIDTMIENGWIWIDDNDQIQVYTTPRERR